MCVVCLLMKQRMGPRLISPSEIERETRRDLPDEQRDVEVRPYRNVEQRRPSRTRPSKSREDWVEEEVQAGSDGEGSAHRDYYESHERWSSRRDDEASSGEEVSRDARYSRGETAFPPKQKGRGYSSTANGRSDGARIGQKRSASAHDSEDDGDLRQSGSQVGPTSPHPAVRSGESDDQLPREFEYNSKDSSDTRRQGGERSVKAPLSNERHRVSVFERTNLAIKPRRTVDSEYDAGEFRDKRIKNAGSQALEDRDHVARETEDTSRQRSGIASKKRRIKRDS